MSHLNIDISFPVDAPDLSASLIKHLEKQCHYLGAVQFEQTINATITEWAQDHGYHLLVTTEGIKLIYDKL